MAREKKIGIMLILAGICIPLVLLPLVSGYAKEKGVIKNLLEVGIVIRKGEPAKRDGAAPLSGTKGTPMMFPFRFVLAFGVFLVFAGIVKMDLSRHRNTDHDV